MHKTTSYHKKVQRARAEKKSAKRALKAKAWQSHSTPTPRSLRIDQRKPAPIIVNPFAQFLAANYRKAIAA